jgi:hypothetical protein
MATARKKQPRSLCLITAPTPEHDGLLRITEGRRVDYYRLRRLVAEGGVAFEFQKQEDGAPLYTVAVGERGAICDCQGRRFGHECRHIRAVRALTKAGKI